MAVRVKVRIKLERKTIECIALVNSGFESAEAEILLPLSLVTDFAKRRKSRTVTYTLAGGRAEKFQFIGKGKARVVCPDRASREVPTIIIAAEHESEAVLNDYLVGSAGLVLLDVRRGVWRFADDPPDTQRQSEPRELY